ncbi:DUF2290 domain-containing protein [Spirochaeta isovalerica]|uniref:DUF2290 domain-containing protein n=1 Tax=Spirochaeta isovalerica TaxID=150 RepID=A0A841RDS0_9SPIO|nr:DUF2290 domain-containing protein [Spirochaeta isovalerica]MBB6481531.1 hypothetical protein [Spirochaeta isovalerica]
MKKNKQTEILKAIKEILLFLIEKGLATDQNQPILKESLISWANYTPGIGFGSNIDYLTIYSEIEESKNYTIKLIDGGLLQYYYKTDRRKIIEHRLAFYPSPLLEDYDSAFIEYEIDELYLEVVDTYLLKTPLRFDYDQDDERHKLVLEPKSHLHLGHTENCRIPVSRPICPYSFTKFVLLNFYNAFYKRYSTEALFSKKINTGENTIHADEQKIFYLEIANKG